jgi:hypothetical protein
MATAVVRRPLVAALLPAASRPSGFRIRQRRAPSRFLAVSSDSSKPVASTFSSSAGGDNPEEEPPVLPLLQELAVSRCVPLTYDMNCYTTILPVFLFVLLCYLVLGLFGSSAQVPLPAPQRPSSRCKTQIRLITPFCM